MASPNAYPNAFATSAPDIALYTGNYLSGSVFWVSSLTGNDANAGTEPELPKATWTSAYAAASAGDVIMVAASHIETVSVANVLGTSNVTTIGLSTGTSRPKFTSAVAGAMWTANVAGLEFHGLYFPASTAATTSRVSIAAGGTDCMLRDCYFECGANDTTNAVAIAGARAFLRSCSFVATASRPARAINLTAAVASCRFEDILIDGGGFGWTSPAFTISGAATLIDLQNVRLANKSDFNISVTATTYKIFGLRSLDNTGCRVVIAA